MPASTSSNTMQRAEVFAAAATCTARLMRDSSPPEATLARLLGACPGFALTRNSMSSLPCAPNSASLGVTLTANRPPAMPSACMSWVMCRPSWSAALLRAAVRRCCGGAVFAGQRRQFSLELGQVVLGVVERGQFRFGARQLLGKLQNVQRGACGPRPRARRHGARSPPGARDRCRERPGSAAALPRLPGC